MQQPVQRKLDMALRRATQQPSAKPIGEVKDGRHGQRIGDPDHRHRHRQVEAQPSSSGGGQQHLPGKGNESEKHAGRQPAHGGAATEMPQTGIVQQLPKKTEILVRAQVLRIGQVTLQKRFHGRGTFNQGAHVDEEHDFRAPQQIWPADDYTLTVATQTLFYE
ncbi:MAG: hypothetical protein R3F40_00645 [Candidatus Competibacteraceae bacterium]